MLDDKNEHWHVGKEVPIALIFAISVQTIGAVWWAATVSAKLDELSYQVAALTADKYTQQDAKRDMQLVDAKIESVRQSLTNIKEDMKWRQKR